MGKSTRRGLLAGTLGAVAALALGAKPGVAQTPQVAGLADSSRRSKVLRFAHPTDIHVQPELRGGEGMAAALRHMMGLREPPTMILNGGDCPMDSASTPYEQSKVRWDLFRKTFADNVPASVKVTSVLGNHDIFGRSKSKAKATGSEPFYGKRWFMENFELTRTWQSFDRAGWHFVLLDSIDWPDGSDSDNYVTRIAGEQLEWLKADLAGTKLPTVVITHVPIVSVVNYFDGDNFTVEGDHFTIDGSRMHSDCRELEELFRTSRASGGADVKLCLSGHIHLYDRCTYNGITYICDGAVSSNKWKGVRRQTPNGYGLIDLYSDGTFEHAYTPFGWTS